MFRQLPIAGLIFLVLSAPLLAQSVSHERSVGEYAALRARLRKMERSILQPASDEVRSAQERGFNAIRLMPRERYEDSLTIRGGGAYYSFTRLTHEYGRGSDIELQRGELSVGFAGADYGFLHDLGEVDLNDVTSDVGPIRVLSRYVPPTDEPTIRAEQRRSQSYEVGGYTFKSRIPALVGHSYVLRSINFATADVLVAFKVMRKDTDGSLVIFWKPIERFRKPEIGQIAERAAQ